MMQLSVIFGRRNSSRHGSLMAIAMHSNHPKVQNQHNIPSPKDILYVDLIQLESTGQTVQDRILKYI